MLNTLPWLQWLLCVIFFEMLASMPEKSMIIFEPQGETKYTVTTFTDIDCGYCRKLHAPELPGQRCARSPCFPCSPSLSLPGTPRLARGAADAHRARCVRRVQSMLL